MGALSLCRSTSLESAGSLANERWPLAERIEVASRQIEVFFSAQDIQTPAETERVIALLDHLLRTARKHFEQEETSMIDDNFPGFTFHKRDHDYLLKNLTYFISALGHGTLPFSNDIGVNLRSWLTYHTRKYDEVYLAFREGAKPEARRGQVPGGGVARR
jgi:hemerythrin-like metal-binding protein